MERPKIEEWKDDCLFAWRHGEGATEDQKRIVTLCDYALELEARVKRLEKWLEILRDFAKERNHISYMQDVLEATKQALKE